MDGVGQQRHRPRGGHHHQLQAGGDKERYETDLDRPHPTLR